MAGGGLGVTASQTTATPNTRSGTTFGRKGKHAHLTKSAFAMLVLMVGVLPNVFGDSSYFDSISHLDMLSFAKIRPKP